MGAKSRLGAHANKYGIPPFNVLSSCFLFVSLNLVVVAVPTVCIVMNFVPQLLHGVEKREFAGGCSSNGCLSVRKFVAGKPHTYAPRFFKTERNFIEKDSKFQTSLKFWSKLCHF